MKITGGAGFSADAIEVFEGINGTLLLAAVSLVIFLLIVIYRSPMFFFIPLIAVMFAEILSRSLGYGISELGVTINGQSSSIMSVLVLGAGTDYALLLVARYREELHRTADKHEAMRTALASAGPAIFASALTVIAALLCLMLAKVNGTAGLGPIAAIGIACAALSMLTLLPALLTIFGRRAFWPFVPHTPETAPDSGLVSERARHADRRRLGAGALLRVILACLLVLVLLPLVLLNWLLRVLSGRRIPSLIVGPLDRAIFTPYEVRRHRLEHAADATHGFWKRVGDRVAMSPARVMIGSVVVLLILCAGLAFFSTDLTSEDSYRDRSRVGRRPEPARQELPGGHDRADRRRRPGTLGSAGGQGAPSPKWTGSRRSRGPSPKGRREPWCRRPSNPIPTRPRPSTWSNRSARRPTGGIAGRPGRRARPRSNSTSATPPRWDSIVIPPIILLVVFLILIGLLRAVIAPLVLIGTVILSFLAALGVGYFVFDVIFGFPGIGPVAAAVRLRLPGRAGGRLQHLPDRPRARGDDRTRLRGRASCAPWRSPAR